MAGMTLENYYDIVVAGDSISKGVVYSKEKVNTLYQT